MQINILNNAIDIIWSALFCLLFVFIRTVSNKEVVLEERVDHIETAFAANPAELLSAPSIDERISYSRQQALKQKSILEQSIALCKNEYAERIANIIREERFDEISASLYDRVCSNYTSSIVRKQIGLVYSGLTHCN